MGIVEIENGVIISKEDYEKYNRLKVCRRNAIDQFAVIKTLLFRLNVFVNLLIENDNDNYEAVLFNVQSAFEELNDYCIKYGSMLGSQGID